MFNNFGKINIKGYFTAFKLCIILVFTLCLSLTITVEKSYAYKAAGHYVLMEKVKEQLRTDSVIRQALTLYPNIAGLGATGPDLGYYQAGTAREYAPWADRFHYDRVGTLAANQLRSAIYEYGLALDESGKNAALKKIAFAAGWVLT